MNNENDTTRSFIKRNCIEIRATGHMIHRIFDYIHIQYHRPFILLSQLINWSLISLLYPFHSKCCLPYSTASRTDQLVTRRNKDLSWQMKWSWPSSFKIFHRISLFPKIYNTLKQYLYLCKIVLWSSAMSQYWYFPNIWYDAISVD